MDYKKELKQLVEKVKLKAKERGEKLGIQEIADIFDKTRTYMSDLLGTHGKVKEEHVLMFKEKFKAYLDEETTQIADPIKEILIINNRLESKMDTLTLLVATMMDIMTDKQKNKVAKVLNDGNYEENEGFKVINEASKKRAESRIRRAKQQEAE